MWQGAKNVETVMMEMAQGCTSCGECVRPCNFLQQQGTPAQIAQRGAAPENLRIAYGCSLCGLCDAVCPEKLSPSGMFLSMRQQAVEKGLVDLKPYQPWLTYEQLGSRPLFQRDQIPRDCTTVFFPGCSLPGTRPEAVKKLFRQLRQQDQSLGLVLDCCGKISHDLGLSERFERVFTKLTGRLQKNGITRILTACPGCSKILRKYADQFEVVSVYEILLEGQEADGKGQNTSAAITGSHIVPVVIHDPCPARFDAGQQQAVRKLVAAAGYQVDKLPFSGSSTRCCGQGGMVEGCAPGTVAKESGVIAAAAAGRPVVSSCGACCETLASTTPTAHIADLLTGTGSFTIQPVSSLKRWLNRLKLRFSRLS